MTTTTINSSPIIDIVQDLPAFTVDDAGRYLIVARDTSKLYRNDGVSKWVPVVFDANTVSILLAMLSSKTSASAPSIPSSVAVNNFPTIQPVIITSNGSPIDLNGTAVVVEVDSDPIGLSFTASGQSFVQDMSGYRSASVNFSVFPAGNIITFYGSEDGLTNWVPHPIDPVGAASGNGTLTAISSTGSWVIPRRTRFIQMVVSTFVAGSTITGQLVLMTSESAGRSMLVNGAVAAGSSVTGYPVPVGGTVRITDTSRSAGVRAEAQFSPESNLFVQAVGGAYGGKSTFRVAASTSGVIKSTPGTVYGVHFINTQTAIRFIHFYNKATPPTIGSDTPIATFPIKANDTIHFSEDVGFTSGISFAITSDFSASTLATSGDVSGTVVLK